MVASERHCRQVFEAVADGLFLLESAAERYQFLEVNEAAARMLGAAGPVGCHLVDESLAPPVAALMNDAANTCLQSGQGIEREIDRAGATYQLKLTPVCEHGAHRVAGVIRDVTQQRRLESELHARAEEFRALVENAPDYITRYDTEGRILYTNPAVERLVRPLQGSLGRTSLELGGFSDSAQRFHAIILEAARTGRATSTELVIGTDILHQPATHHVRFVPEHDQQGKVVSVLAIGRDITEIKKNEDKMRALAEHLSLATAVARLGIMTFDLSGEEVTVDAGVRAIHGFTPDIGVTQALGAALLPEDRPRTEASWFAALQERKPFSLEYRIRRSDGDVRWVENHALPVAVNGSVTSVLVVISDITDRKRAEQQRLQLEAQLRQAQKLEALGTLAGGIAHDFNNILSAVLGNAALVAQDLAPAHTAQASVAEIHKAAQRAKDLVRRLLAFGRPHDQQHRRLRLPSVVEEVIKLLRPTMPKTIDLVFKGGQNVPPVLIDAGQISQVLMNLCVNAQQAMPDGKGRIDIEIDVRDVPKGVLPVPAGRYVLLSVRDDGSGMSAEVLEHIFEPFYTTKPFGEGTGLGLAMVHGIVRAHGGAVTVQGGVDRGTTFDIYLPALPEDTVCDPYEPEGRTPPSVKGTGQRILYIDDEESLVLLIKRVFERVGYRPECFTDPQAAIAAFRADPQRYDLVITDLSMPGTSGMDVAKAVLAIEPNATVVLASGYVRPHEVEAAKAIGIKEVILKPNTVEEMTAAVERLLEHELT